MGWEDDVAREQRRYEDGLERGDPEQLVRIGNAAYGAGLALLMLGRREEAAEWLERAALRWRESWAHATPTSWGRPIGVVKASVLAGGEGREAAEWALSLGPREAESAIGRYAATLALLVLGRRDEAAALAASLQGREDFPPAVADALASVAAGEAAAFGEAAEAVLRSFETREAYLEDVAVADTVLVLEALARARGLRVELRPSAVLPPQRRLPAAGGST
jgi:hypothetical protein